MKQGAATRRIAVGIGMAALALTWIAAGASSALAVSEVYCYPNASVDPSCAGSNANLQMVMSMAQNDAPADHDTVLLGAGSHSIVGNQGYNDASPGNSVEIRGAGVGVTVLNLSNTAANRTGMIFSAPAGSTMSGFSLVVPGPDDPTGDNGLSLGGQGLTHDVAVTGPDAANVIGALMQGNAILDDAVIDLETQNVPENFGVRSGPGQTTVTDSVLVGDFGGEVFDTGAVLTVERSTIRARKGLSAPVATIIARSTVIDLGAIPNSIGLLAENPNEGLDSMTITASNTTIVGGGTGAVGVKAIGDSNGGPPDPFGGAPDDTVDDGETASVSLSSSVISGPDPAILVGTDRGEVATVTSSYSNYTAPAVEDDDLSNGNADGDATLTETDRTTHATPGFVNDVPGGDFHLLAGSPLIDIGDPAPPNPGQLDIDGDQRAIDATVDCFATSRRDIGADEFVTQGLLDCVAPETTVSGKGKGKVKAKKKRAKVTFILSSTEPGSSFECSLDGAPFAPCTSPFSTKAKRGSHTLTVRAKDASGNQDATPAKHTFKVTKKKAKRK